MNIGIASDHRGYRLKEKLLKYLHNLGYNTIDFGTTSRQAVDYPDFAFALGEAVVNKTIDIGIAICGSGIGISIACNKVKGVRCAKVDSMRDAKVAKLDNNANILAISGRMSTFRAKDIVDVFVQTDYEEVPRHQKRIDKITEYENKTTKTRTKKAKKEKEQKDEC